jgi:hypothetical protein
MLGHHTVAIIKGHESYELLERSCSKIFKQINILVRNKTVTVNGTNIPVEVYLGGDYKVNIIRAVARSLKQGGVVLS